MQERHLMLVGDPNDINTWSNTSYYFLQAGLQAQFLTSGLPLQPQRLALWRIVWNLVQLLRTGQSSGFQYSSFFARRLLSQVSLGDKPLELISHFPLLPTQPIPDHWQLNYYLDATTQQVFDEYGLGEKLASSFRKEVLERETRNYQRAKRIICMCQWAADSVINDYDIDPSKVFVIPGGANLDEDLLSQLPTIDPPPLQPLRLGFIGKDWQRKGLPLLFQVAEILDSRGYTVEVLVIGPPAEKLPSHKLLRALGFLDKQKQIPEFVDVVRSFHFGCLFSQAEASPRSNLECLRLGVPVLSLRVGGIPDTVPDRLGHLFEPDVQAIVIADAIQFYLENPDQYLALRERVTARANEFSWGKAIEQMRQIW